MLLLLLSMRSALQACWHTCWWEQHAGVGDVCFSVRRCVQATVITMNDKTMCSGGPKITKQSSTEVLTWHGDEQWMSLHETSIPRCTETAIPRLDCDNMAAVVTKRSETLPRGKVRTIRASILSPNIGSSVHALQTLLSLTLPEGIFITL